MLLVPLDEENMAPILEVKPVAFDLVEKSGMCR